VASIFISISDSLGRFSGKHPDRDPGMGRITVYLWGLGGASAFCTPRRLKPLGMGKSSYKLHVYFCESLFYGSSNSFI
jgi:hypothetical protein